MVVCEILFGTIQPTMHIARTYRREFHLNIYFGDESFVTTTQTAPLKPKENELCILYLRIFTYMI